MRVDLATIRNEILSVYDSRRKRDDPIGRYKYTLDGETNLYASLDVVISYAIMGINPNSFNEKYKSEWISYINSYVDNEIKDGRYNGLIPHHSITHANGMVIGALGYLGGKQIYPVKFYDSFNSVIKIETWLENINWPHQWACEFKGGPCMFSMSKYCPSEWINVAINWLTSELDPITGMWKREVTPATEYNPLGGFVHIYPLYELHLKEFPYPNKVIRSVLDLQNSKGNWWPNNELSYLDMDALYAYSAMLRINNTLHDEVIKSTRKYAKYFIDFYQKNKKDIFKNSAMHGLLALVSTFGLLNQLLPNEFYDTVQWTDILSDRRLYQTSLVEV